MTQSQTRKERRAQAGQEQHPPPDRVEVGNIDALLDEIDEILEANACAVLEHNRQRGGQ